MMRIFVVLLLFVSAPNLHSFRRISARKLLDCRYFPERSSSREVESSSVRAYSASSDDEVGDPDEDENEQNIVKFELADFKGALIKEEQQPSFEEFKAKQAAESSSAGGPAGRALDYNWRMGLCKHYVAFEGSDTIRRFKFLGDLLAFGMISGQVALIRMSTGEILDRFKHHDCEVTAIDFDGINLVTGAADGKIVHYSLTYGGEGGSTEKDTTTDLEALLASSETTTEDIDPSEATAGDGMSPQNAMGDVKGIYDSFHTRSVTSARLVRIPNGNDAESTYLVSTSMDKSLNCMDIITGKVLYSMQLDTAPICMDAFSSRDSGNAYIAVGTIDGKVLVISPKSGKTLLNFQADDRIRSIHFTSETIIVTGGNSGAVRRWNLDADEGTSRESDSRERRRKPGKSGKRPSSSSSNIEKATSSKENFNAEGGEGASKSFKNSGRFIDFYFQSLIEGQDESGNKSTQGGDRSGSSDSSKSIGRTSRSPTVEKAASAMRRRGSDTSSSSASERERDIEEDGVVSVSSAHALGSVMNERQRVYIAEDQKSPVVSVQADDSKIVACYEDGSIKAWDVISMTGLFDLQGRTSLISCCQFDATRLIADGTHHILVTHDFSDSPEAEDNDKSNTFTYDGTSDGGDAPDDGKPSSTS